MPPITPILEPHPVDKAGYAPGREAVLEQLDRLLTSRFFSNSKRCPAMLRYVVQQVVDGRMDSLKERSLGIEVFHRQADYDNNNDPIVRLAAGEIRKRLAQYYCEPEHAGELRISLPAGSYLPEFHLPELVAQPAPQTAAALIETPAESEEEPTRTISWRVVAGLSAGLLLCAVVIAGLKLWWLRPLSERFWSGIFSTKAPVLICVGQPDRYLDGPNYRKLLEETNLGSRIAHLDQLSMPDAIAVTRIAGILAKHDVDYSLKGEESATLDDMRTGPTILVSGADNVWTLRATKDLRFHFEAEPVGTTSARVRIVDREHPESRAWVVDFGIPYTALSQDYAIVGRFTNSMTREPNVVAAGIGANGTLVASECLSNANCLKAILERDPAKGRKNIEAVLGTQVIDGKSGPPTILAVHSW